MTKKTNTKITDLNQKSIYIKSDWINIPIKFAVVAAV